MNFNRPPQINNRPLEKKERKAKILERITSQLKEAGSAYRYKLAFLLLAGINWGQVGHPKPHVKPHSVKETKHTPAVAHKPTSHETFTTIASRYGHLSYRDISEDELVSIGNEQWLNKAAVEDYSRMVEAAREEGITLFPISSFRSTAHQEHLFEREMRERGETEEERSKKSAPPGHSEHHTGDAIDFNTLDPDFDKTATFKWMHDHASAYHFELSFPEHNQQGVMYEPWHWRWVGDAEAKKALYRDKPYTVTKGHMTYVRNSELAKPKAHT